MSSMMQPFMAAMSQHGLQASLSHPPDSALGPQNADDGDDSPA